MSTQPSLSDLMSDKLQSLPTGPGVYQYKDAEGTIIYVGKAKNLRNRVRSYFQAGRPKDAKTNALVRKIANIEIIVTDTELEALVLEDTLIKKHRPKYNIRLKDDKRYPYIRITNEEFPRVLVTRTVVRDGSQYFGPYTEAVAMRSVLKTIRSTFAIRSCDLDLSVQKIAAGKYSVCLDYQIKKCDGPCEAHISKSDYRAQIKKIEQILKGKTRDIERELERRMTSLAENFLFEQAAVVRDRLKVLSEYSARQKVVSTDLADRDVMSVAFNDEDACAVILRIREGKLIGKQHYYLTNALGASHEEILQAAFERFYSDQADIPEEIFLPTEVEDIEMLRTWISSLAHKSVSIAIPKIGDKAKLVKMAESNAEYLLKEVALQRAKRDQDIPRAVLSLQRDLRLKAVPIRIECFDNSHIQGSETVSSMVVFVEGKPRKSEYRKYKIQSVEGINDFASMREVLTRRYSRMLREKSDPPDLIIVDGGKGQLSVAYEVLESLGLAEKIPIIGLAKRLEEVFLPGEKEPVFLPKTSSSLRLVQQLRDEAHRFAIEFHRKLRDRRTLSTELTSIPGIGSIYAKKLLIAFGSVDGVRHAEIEKIAAVVGNKAAQLIEEWKNNTA